MAAGSLSGDTLGGQGTRIIHFALCDTSFKPSLKVRDSESFEILPTSGDTGHKTFQGDQGNFMSLMLRRGGKSKISHESPLYISEN